MNRRPDEEESSWEMRWETSAWSNVQFKSFFNDLKEVRSYKTVRSSILAPSSIFFRDSGTYNVPLELKVKFDSKDRQSRALVHYPSDFWTATPHRLTSLLINLVDAIHLLHSHSPPIYYRSFDPAFFFIKTNGTLELLPIGIGPPRSMNEFPNVSNPDLRALALDPAMKMRLPTDHGEGAFTVSTDLVQFGMFVMTLLVGHPWSFPDTLTERITSGSGMRVLRMPSDADLRATIFHAFRDKEPVQGKPAVRVSDAFKELFFNMVYRLLYLASPYVSFGELAKDLQTLHSLPNDAPGVQRSQPMADFLDELFVGRAAHVRSAVAFVRSDNGLESDSDDSMDSVSVPIAEQEQPIVLEVERRSSRGIFSPSVIDDLSEDYDEYDGEEYDQEYSDSSSGISVDSHGFFHGLGELNFDAPPLPPRSKFLLVTGRPGFGVTKFLWAVAKEVSTAGTHHVVMLSPNNTPARPLSLVYAAIEEIVPLLINWGPPVLEMLNPETHAMLCTRFGMHRDLLTVAEAEVAPPNEGMLDIVRALTAVGQDIFIAIDDIHRCSKDDAFFFSSMLAEKELQLSLAVGLVQYDRTHKRALPRAIREAYQTAIGMSQSVDVSMQMQITLGALTTHDIMPFVEMLEIHSGTSREDVAEKLREACKGVPAGLQKVLRILAVNNAFGCHRGSGRWVLHANAIAKAAAATSSRLTARYTIPRRDTEATAWIVATRAAVLGSTFSNDQLVEYFKMSKLAEDRELDTDNNRVLFVLLNLVSERRILVADQASASGSQMFSFVTQRAREDVLATVSDGAMEYIQYNMGRYFTAVIKRQKGNKDVNSSTSNFIQLSHYNRAVSLVKESNRIRLASMNYKAGKEALKGAAMEAALHYFTAGLSLLSTVKALPEDFKQLPWNLVVESVECSFVLGQASETAQRLTAARKHAKTMHQKLYLTIRQMRLHTSLGNPKTALDEGFKALMKDGMLKPPSVGLSVRAEVHELYKGLDTHVPVDNKTLNFIKSTPVTLTRVNDSGPTTKSPALLQIFDSCVECGRLEQGLSYILATPQGVIAGRGEDLTPEVLLSWLIYGCMRLWRNSEVSQTWLFLKAVMKTLEERCPSNYYRQALIYHIRFAAIYRRTPEKIISLLVQAECLALEEKALADCGKCLLERLKFMFFLGGPVGVTCADASSASSLIARVRSRALSRPTTVFHQLLQNMLSARADIDSVVGAGRVADVISVHAELMKSEDAPNAFTATLAIQLALILTWDLSAVAAGISLLADKFEVAWCTGLAVHYLAIMSISRHITAFGSSTSRATACLADMDTVKNITANGAYRFVEAVLAALYIHASSGPSRALRALLAAQEEDAPPLWAAIISMLIAQAAVQCDDSACARTFADEALTTLKEASAEGVVALLQPRLDAVVDRPRRVVTQTVEEVDLFATPASHAPAVVDAAVAPDQTLWTPHAREDATAKTPGRGLSSVGSRSDDTGLLDALSDRVVADYYGSVAHSEDALSFPSESYTSFDYVAIY
ncbi:hypothetical protein J8273_4343 [Carpediemonas membranifera]|uniref:Protein kinase domain-containing protein n=1 Tax=Carpediemonas membranifera TaxID=201153 RepID=A0A8J6E2E8_9EUKA|nr:hypothetical protein J8273_4343 [Carpediemonas membranifera]|eukprot:KAG9394241.1 hypothetical protein J8273_4343 [Carpediemonas membranifera]